MPLLSEIQTALLKGDNLAPVLLKLRFLAARLGSDALAEWVKYESEGYPNTVEVPEYRKLPVSYKANFNGPFGKSISNISVPSYTVAQLAGEHWLTHEDRESIAAIEALIEAANSSGENPEIDASNLVLFFGMNVFQGMACHSVRGIISRTTLVELQNTVRTRILELTIEIENSIPESVNIDVVQESKMEKTKEMSAVTNNITHNVIHGNQNTTTISQSGSSNSINFTVNQGDIGTLKKSLQEVGFDDHDASSFSEIVAAEKPENDKEPFGVKAKVWLKQNIGKAADKVGFAVAAKLIADCVAQYYGLK